MSASWTVGTTRASSAATAMPTLTRSCSSNAPSTIGAVGARVPAQASAHALTIRSFSDGTARPRRRPASAAPRKASAASISTSVWTWKSGTVAFGLGHPPGDQLLQPGGLACQAALARDAGRPAAGRCGGGRRDDGPRRLHAGCGEHVGPTTRPRGPLPLSRQVDAVRTAIRRAAASRRRRRRAGAGAGRRRDRSAGSRPGGRRGSAVAAERRVGRRADRRRDHLADRDVSPRRPRSPAPSTPHA